MAKRAPRLQFTDEELSAPEVRKAAQKADRCADKLEKREAKIPKKAVKTEARVIDPDTGKVTTRVFVSEAEKKRPPSKLTHAVSDAPGAVLSSAAHREIRSAEDDNVGVESAHKLEEAAEGSIRFAQAAHRSHVEKPYRKAEQAAAETGRANLRALHRQAEAQNPEAFSNPYSKWQQKQAIKKEYAAAKAGRTADQTVRAGETTAKAAKRASEAGQKVSEFVSKHKKGFLIVGAIAAMLLMLLNVASSCSVLTQGGASAVGMSTYPSADADMLAAEAQYCAMEAELQRYLDTYESTHDYDEYHFDLDGIEHDPYVLLSILSAFHPEGWTLAEVEADLQTLFDRQYILTESVEVEVRYRTETRTDSEGNTYDVEVPYNYFICTVTLENFNLSHVPVYIMGEDQLSRYALYMAALGNRSDLFPGSAYIGKYGGPVTTYDIPPEALEDEQFAAMIAEAEKYLGYPYVWGGSSPATSFDCSGFVSWVVNHCGVGWDVGRLGATGLYHICTPVSSANAKPGDLIFFQGTYDTDGMSHVGIYVGGGMMIHCGDPIQYANINTSYWQAHFAAFGRLP